MGVGVTRGGVAVGIAGGGVGGAGGGRGGLGRTGVTVGLGEVEVPARRAVR